MWFSLIPKFCCSPSCRKNPSPEPPTLQVLPQKPLLKGSFSPAVLPSCLWNLVRREEPGQPKKKNPKKPTQDGFGSTNVFIYFKGGWCSGGFCQLKWLWLPALPWLRPQREKWKLSHKDLQKQAQELLQCYKPPGENANSILQACTGVWSQDLQPPLNTKIKLFHLFPSVRMPPQAHSVSWAASVNTCVVFIK